MNKMIKVEIPEETARTVERLAREKGFNSVEAYVEALIHENLDVTSKEREAKLAALDAAIARGIVDADAGRCASIDEVFDRLEKKFRDLASRRDEGSYRARSRGRSSCDRPLDCARQSRRAVTFVEELRRACAKLAETAMAYPILERYRHLGIRRRPSGTIWCCIE